MLKITRFVKPSSNFIKKYFSEVGEIKKNSEYSITKILESYKNLFDKSNILEDLLPRQFKSEDELASFFDLNSLSPYLHIRDSITLDSINTSVNTPIWEFLDRGGKRWRPILGLMVSKYLNINIDDYEINNLLYNILGCIEILHNATLIIDDVIDNSDFRRNKPCTYKIFGNGIAINAGIGLFFYPVIRTIRNLDDDKKGKFLINYIYEMSAINFGQTLDYEMNNSKRIIFISNYIDTVLCKTGVIPRLMIKLIYDFCIKNQNLSRTRNKMLKIIDLLSIAFQIADDLLNICENDLSRSKGFLGEDIYEGKLTIMVIKALENLNKLKADRLREILFMKTKKSSLLNEGVELIKSGGGIEFAIEYKENCVNEAIQLCLGLPCDNETSRESIFEIIELIKYLIKRKE